MEFVVNNLTKPARKEIWQIDRGTTFGYQNLVVDMRSFSIMAGHGTPTIIDATFTAYNYSERQAASAADNAEYVAPLARAALAAGANGVFLETHLNPEVAISDAASQIPLEELKALVASLLRVWKAVRESGTRNEHP